MIPFLFDRGQVYRAVEIRNIGYGTLDECIRCEVTEEINGVYECEFDYPITGQYFPRLVSGGYCIAVIHDHLDRIQLFDIYRYEAHIEGIVTFYASHVSYRLANSIGGFENGAFYTEDLTTALQYCIGGNIQKPWGSFLIAGNYSGISTIDPFYFPERWNAREMLLGSNLGTVMYYGTDLHDVKSVRERFGGEFRFNNFDIYYYDKRGSNNGVQIIYGKNLSGIDRECDRGSLVSRVYPIWKDTNGVCYAFPGQTSSQLTIDKFNWTVADDPVNIHYFMPMTDENGTQLEFRVPDIRSAIYDISGIFETLPTNAQARQAALDYMSKNSTWKPVDNITIDFIDLFDSPEYASIKNLESCSLGDFVSVYYAELGVVVENVEIVSATFDVLAERFKQMQLNSMRSTLAEIIIDSMGGK